VKHGREKELKFLIASREDFRRLRDDPAWGTRSEPERQVNHYFDSSDRRLVRARVLLRLREEGIRVVLTLKCGTEVRPGFFDSLEIEEEVDPGVLARALEEPESLVDLPLAAIAELQRRFGRPPLVVAGTLVNERVRRETGVGPSNLVLEVDRLLFPDGSEAYELEIETSDPPRAEAWVHDTIIAAGVRLEPQRMTKMERFLEWLDHSGTRTRDSGC